MSSWPEKIVYGTVAAVFLHSGAFKLGQHRETIEILKQLGPSATVAMLILAIVVTLELYVGVGLLFFSDKRPPMWTALGCLLVFSVYLGYLSTLMAPPKCGCGNLFAFFESNRKNAVVGLVRNVGLAAMILWWMSRRTNLAEATISETHGAKLHGSPDSPPAAGSL